MLTFEDFLLELERKGIRKELSKNDEAYLESIYNKGKTLHESDPDKLAEIEAAYLAGDKKKLEEIVGLNIALEKDVSNVDQTLGIIRDDRGVYGYLPKENSRYYRFKDKFMDVNWVEKQRNIRKDYLEQSKELEITIANMRSENKSSETIARHVVDQRNQQKVDARKFKEPEEVKALEDGNLKKYGNSIGPTADDLFEKYGDWDKIIESSMRKDPEINKLLGLE